MSVLSCLAVAASSARAQNTPVAPAKPVAPTPAQTPVVQSGGSPADKTGCDSAVQQLEIYGFGQGDGIYQFNVNDPNWFDTNRPTKLPAFTNEFGLDHHTWLSVRQSRFGVKGTFPTDHGPIKTRFEFDMFGVGIDQGQTTIRLRYAYGQWGQFGAGQLDSPFMDIDVFPNILDYWGPNGMIFFRNVQIFWRPIDKDSTRVTLALERPGASADGGIYADHVELQDIALRFPAPDISAEYRYGREWGYVKLAGIVRWIRWDDLLTDTLDLSGRATGWGVNLSSNVKPTKRDVVRLQVIYGEGVENYFNDAPIDIGVENNLNDPRRPILGKALPDLGLVAYLDHKWNSKWTSSLGWSMVQITNSDAQLPSDFRNGQYASINGLYSPLPDVMMGAEFQWAYRRNFDDDFTANDYRVQVSFKYSYSKKFGGN